MKKEIIQEDLEDIYCRNIPWSRLENKTVLITGAYGMLASYMVFELMYLNEIKGIPVKIIAVGRSKEKFVKRFGDVQRCEYLKFFTSDLNDELQIDEKVDFIIHAASFASPEYYSVCPVEVLKPNIIGHYHLLELAVYNNVEGYLLFSTGDVYGHVSGRDKICENDYGSLDTLDIHSCYGESKRMAETMCKAWFHQKGVPVKIARICHTYAPTMDIEADPRVFASFVKDVVHGQNIIMKSDGSAKRSFCYIADAIAGYFLILLCGQNGEAYNVCNSNSFCSIRELAEILVDLYPEKGLKVVRAERNKEDIYVENRAANNIPVDSSKLEALGWEARYGIKAGFRKVIESIRGQHFTKEDVEIC